MIDYTGEELYAYDLEIERILLRRRREARKKELAEICKMGDQ